ncbi:MAG: SBBP repeat-containing protein [Flavobacteriales bacterium]|nr:SBBP repeat-containing protein [Flavobacteriales bacterium]
MAQTVTYTRQMIRAKILGVFLFVTASLNAQNSEWVRSFGGPNAGGVGNSLTVDASGNVYTTGYFEGTVDFDPGTGTSYLTSNGNRDVFVQKMNANGNFLWARSFGGIHDDESYSIAVDASGNVYTTGYFEETADFDPGTGTSNLTSNGNEDVFVQKMNANGNFLWARSFGGIHEDESYSIVVDASGNVYTTGGFYGNVDFDPGPGTSYLVGNESAFMLKLDTNGNFLWARSPDSIYSEELPSSSEGYSITLDASGNVYATGIFSGTVDFDTGPGNSYHTSAGGGDIFVQKMDVNGNFLWARSFGGIEDEYGFSIAVDASGNVYTTGQYRGTADFDPGAGTINYTSAGEGDDFVQKMDANGNFLWARSFGGFDQDYGYSIVDASGNVYTTGDFYGTVDFDPGTGTSYLTSLGAIAAFVQKLDADGNFIWARSYGGTSPTTDGVSSGKFTVDSAGNIYTTGYFYGTVDFDQGAGTSNLTAVGNTDIFVQKMGQTPSDIIDLGSGIQFAAYPNPSTGKVCLTFSQTVGQVKVILTDIQGKVISEQTLDPTSNSGFEMPGTPGAYYLTVKTSQGQSVVKLVKE